MTASLLKTLGALLLVGATAVGAASLHHIHWHTGPAFDQLAGSDGPLPSVETNGVHHYDRPPDHYGGSAIANTTIMCRADLRVKLLVGAMVVGATGDDTRVQHCSWLRSSTTQTCFTCSANSSVPRAPVETNCVHHYDDTTTANTACMNTYLAPRITGYASLLAQDCPTLLPTSPGSGKKVLGLNTAVTHF